jgi:hypothetical protein
VPPLRVKRLLTLAVGARRAYLWRVEIIPGVGIEDVRIGDRRQAVDARLGGTRVSTDSRAYYESLGVLVHFDGDDLVELIEVGYRDDGRDQPALNGVPLTYRYMDEVLRELAGHGHVGEPSDIGYLFPAGFAIFSMSSLSAQDLDPSASVNDGRVIVEGLSIAPYAYFGCGR